MFALTALCIITRLLNPSTLYNPSSRYLPVRCNLDNSTPINRLYTHILHGTGTPQLLLGLWEVAHELQI